MGPPREVFHILILITLFTLIEPKYQEVWGPRFSVSRILLTDRVAEC